MRVTTTKVVLLGCLLLLGALIFVAPGFLQRASFPAAQAQTRPPGPMLFEGARLIVGDGTAAVENSAFIVESGRFTKIGRKGEIQAPADAVRVDLTGRTVMPAMIDTHGHIGGGRQQIIDQLNLLAYCGVGITTSMGSNEDVVFDVRANPPADGAQILTSGRGMVGPLGRLPATLALGAEGRIPENLRNNNVQVTTEEQAREHVQELANKNADFIKIWVDSRLGTEEPMSPAVYRALLDEAHIHHLRVFAHMWFLQDAKDLARAGLDAFAHPIRDLDVDDEFVQLLKDRPNVYMQTNLHSTQYLTLTEEPDWLKTPDQLLLDIATPAQMKALHDEIKSKVTRTHEGWPTNMSKVEFARKTYGIMTRNTAKLYKAGIPYAIGTDGGTPPKGFHYHDEIELVVKDVGLTTSQAISMATRDAARALEMDRHVGTVQSGKDASFLVLTANPLEDIRNTRRIDKVYLRGHEVDRAGFLKNWKRKLNIS